MTSRQPDTRVVTQRACTATIRRRSRRSCARITSPTRMPVDQPLRALARLARCRHAHRLLLGRHPFLACPRQDAARWRAAAGTRRDRPTAHLWAQMDHTRRTMQAHEGVILLHAVRHGRIHRSACSKGQVAISCRNEYVPSRAKGATFDSGSQDRKVGDVTWWQSNPVQSIVGSSATRLARARLKVTVRA